MYKLGEKLSSGKVERAGTGISPIHLSNWSVEILIGQPNLRSYSERDFDLLNLFNLGG